MKSGRNNYRFIVIWALVCFVSIGAFIPSAFASDDSGRIKWKADIGIESRSSPAIGTEGTLYVMARYGTLCAVSPLGEIQWTFKTGGDFNSSSPAVGHDGTIYVGSDDQSIYAINPDGSRKWSFYTAGSIRYSSPAIAFDGTVYIGSEDEKLYAINPDGTQKWTFDTGKEIVSSPAIGKDGTVYIVSEGHLYAINSDGTQKWHLDLHNNNMSFTPYSYTASSKYSYTASSPAIGSDGTIYVGTRKDKLYAVKPDGTIKWYFQTGDWIDSSPAIAPDGTIYVSSDDDYLMAINPEGTLKWAFKTLDDVNSSPAIGSDGTVFVGSDDGYLYAVNPDGTEKWSAFLGTILGINNEYFGSVYSSPVVSPNGTIYVGSTEGFFAIESGTSGYADSPWPMFHQNPQHSGKDESAINSHCTVIDETINQTICAEYGHFADSDLWIRAVIHTEDKGPIEAVWKEGGKSTTGRGDTVIWGYFYASPSDVSWGSSNNPDLFVKIWKDVNGPVYVDYFHVSVPDITVYTDFPYDGNPDEQGTATLTNRFVEHFYINGVSDSKVQTEDGIPAAGYSPAENPTGSALINSLRIGTMINTVDKGSIEGVWRQGGTDTTARGDQVVWGYFYADPNTVSWGSRENPDLFVKTWFDVGGAVFVDFFHVSVPDIEVYSELPNDGYYDNRGTAILSDRFIEHRYSR